MNTLLMALYLLGAVVTGCYVAYNSRASSIREYPEQEHDNPGDWATYLYFGSTMGLCWPVVVPFYLLAVGISRFVKSRRKNGISQ